MNLPEFLEKDADGYVHVSGHRIGLQDLVYFYNEGNSPEVLVEMFPTISLPIIHKTIAFYLENLAEVDSYVSECEQEMEQQRLAAPRGPDASELRRRIATRQAAGA